MKYEEIKKLATNVNAKDLTIYSLSLAKYNKAINAKVWTPISLSIEVTYWCNRRCKGCYIPDGVKKENSTIEPNFLESIIKQAKEIKIPFIGFAGGEPLFPTSRNIIYQTIENHSLTPFFVYTNGDFVKSASEELKRHHNMAYMVSLDGLEYNHDEIRGKGSFEKVTKSFEILKNFQKIYGASVTVRKKSQEDITSEKFFEYLNREGVKFVRIRTLKNSNEEIDEEKTRNIIRLTKEHADKYNLILNWGGLNKQDSALPSRDLLVGLDGTVRSTGSTLEKSFGNLKSKSLKQIIREINNKFTPNYSE